VVQQNPNGNPFVVDVFGGFVRGGMAGSVFINDGGILTIDQLTVSNVTAISLVSTANLGTTFVEETDISSSSIEVRKSIALYFHRYIMAANSLLSFCIFLQTIFSTVNRATTAATNVRVFDMEAIMTVYSAVGTSTLNLDGGSVFDNNPDNLWIAVDVDEGSTGNILNTTFVNNVNTEYVFSSRLGSTVTLQGAQVTDSVGGSLIVSISAIRKKNPLAHIVCSHTVH
jgi:hypothetical protein